MVAMNMTHGLQLINSFDNWAKFQCWWFLSSQIQIQIIMIINTEKNKTYEHSLSNCKKGQTRHYLNPA